LNFRLIIIIIIINLQIYYLIDLVFYLKNWLKDLDKDERLLSLYWCSSSIVVTCILSGRSRILFVKIVN